MGKTTAISWTDHTFNPWTGCEKLSPACAHCYAADNVRRWGKPELWQGQFEMRADHYWRKPISWNAEAATRQTPRFVFCASMADVFQDAPELEEPRERLWELIDRTPWLVWLLLTKRPEKISELAPASWSFNGAPPNVWLGTSVENARFTWRARELVRVPAAVHFLSCEPLLGTLIKVTTSKDFDVLRDTVQPYPKRAPLDLTDIEWVIGGGESGPRFRAHNPDHARELRDACNAAEIPFWWKQNSGRFPGRNIELDGQVWHQRPVPAAPLLTLF